MSMDITGVTSTSDLAAATTASSTTSDMGEDTFLKLLTTQLQYQDPTEPMSNTEFVAQLAQFTQVQQLQGLSDKVEALYYVNTSMNNAAMTNLMGSGVVAEGDTFHYDATGDKSLWFDASTATSSTDVTIKNESGDVVYSGPIGPLPEGESSWTWNGVCSDGSLAPEGDYTFSVSATDENGGTVDVTTLVRGVVDSMSFESGTATPSIDGVTINLADIVRLLPAEDI